MKLRIKKWFEGFQTRTDLKVIKRNLVNLSLINLMVLVLIIFTTLFLIIGYLKDIKVLISFGFLFLIIALIMSVVALFLFYLIQKNRFFVRKLFKNKIYFCLFFFWKGLQFSDYLTKIEITNNYDFQPAKKKTKKATTTVKNKTTSSGFIATNSSKGIIQDAEVVKTSLATNTTEQNSKIIDSTTKLQASSNTHKNLANGSAGDIYSEIDIDEIITKLNQTTKQTKSVQVENKISQLKQLLEKKKQMLLEYQELLNQKKNQSDPEVLSIQTKIIHETSKIDDLDKEITASIKTLDLQSKTTILSKKNTLLKIYNELKEKI